MSKNVVCKHAYLEHRSKIGFDGEGRRKQTSKREDFHNTSPMEEPWLKQDYD